MSKIDNSLFTTLALLKRNNNRDWYHANKDLMEQARRQLESLINDMLPKIRTFDSNVGLWEAKKTLYRQSRDTRFSSDKTPYKTHVAANICYGNTRDHNKPGYYIHFEDDHCLLAGGVPFPEHRVLKKLRDEIYYNTEEFISIIESKKTKKYFVGLESECCLKTYPKGYPKDCKAMEYLRHKNFLFSLNVAPQKALSDDFESYVLDVFSSITELNKFLFRAID